MWQQVYTVLIIETRNFQRPWSMVYHCMHGHSSPSPPGAPPSSPDSTVTCGVDTPASSWWQESPLSRLQEKNSKITQKVQTLVTPSGCRMKLSFKGDLAEHFLLESKVNTSIWSCVYLIFSKAVSSPAWVFWYSSNSMSSSSFCACRRQAVDESLKL